MTSLLPNRPGRRPAAAAPGGDGPRRVVVVGGGIAGLATAALLASRGHEVDLLEKNDELGGRVGSVERDGFRFDTGASWYLMPEVFEHFFSLLGTSAAAELDLTVLDPSYRVFFEEHEPVDVRPDRAHNRALFEAIEPGAGERFDAYLRSAEETYDVALGRFLYSNFDAPSAFLHPDVVRRSPRLARLLTRSLGDHAAARFSDHRLRQLLGYPAVFLGSSPDRAPSIYHLMSSLDLGDRVLYPQGGFTRLVAAIAGLAERHGARLHTGTPVTRILASEGSRRHRPRVTGVEHAVDGGSGRRTLPADVVVGAADLHHLETALLPPALQTHPEPVWRRRDPGPGAVLAMLGVDGRLPQLPHHSLFFTSDWERNFGDIFGRHPRVPDPASVYVCKPSETDPTVAPEGCENLFVLVPVPADETIGHGGDDGQGSPQVERATDAAIDQVAGWAGVPDLRDRIRVRHTVGPADFAGRYHAWRGGALGLEHTLRQSAFFRPANVSSTVDGLLYAGASTVPGVGLPMCLISAELVLKRLSGDRSPAPVDG